MNVTPTTDRNRFAELIAARLSPLKDELRSQWQANSGRYFVIDELLPPELARSVFERFPEAEAMMVRKTLREYKHVAAQMNRFDAVLEEIVFGFQQPSVLEVVKDIVGLQDLHPDDRLYAGGISLMTPGQFLNPHLDNSHDGKRERYRTLNLLYYVSPDWNTASGGHLELWPQGVTQAPQVLESRFNRLIVMATNPVSWHSVCEVKGDRRCCVSNYYFSDQSPTGHPYFHVTSFRGRPEQPVRDVVLRADAALRSGLRKVFKKGVVKTRHIYSK